MNVITLQGIDIPYKIDKKNNKHTYFYFKKAGYVQVNMSKRQTKQDVIHYMEKHSESFVGKYNKHCIDKKDYSIYNLWGVPYRIVQSENDRVEIDAANKIVNVGIHDIDHPTIKKLEKAMIQQEVQDLFETYQNHPLVDVSNVKLSIRSMVTRFGSCNKHKRRITINLDLIHFDKRYIKYVFLHEISHLVHDNHSADYYALLEQLCPNYKTLRKELKEVW